MYKRYRKRGLKIKSFSLVDREYFSHKLHYMYVKEIQWNANFSKHLESCESNMTCSRKEYIDPGKCLNLKPSHCASPTQRLHYHFLRNKKTDEKICIGHCWSLGKNQTEKRFGSIDKSLKCQ